MKTGSVALGTLVFVALAFVQNAGARGDGGGTMYGPCVKPGPGIVVVPTRCASTCIIYCTDPCNPFDYGNTAGFGCQGTNTTPCTEFTVNRDEELCLTCSCSGGDPVGVCHKGNTYPSGTVPLTSCELN